jgi:hypothetical protein
VPSGHSSIPFDLQHALDVTSRTHLAQAFQEKQQMATWQK